MARSVSPDSSSSKARAWTTRISSGVAAGAALLLAAALFGLVPARTPSPVASIELDPEAAVDRARELVAASAVLPAHRLRAWAFPLCQAPERAARLYRLGVRGASATFAVFCQGEYLLLEVEAHSEPPRVTRLGRFPLRGELPGGATELDLDGDSTSDLVLGVAPREGVVHRPPSGLYFLRGRAQGGYENARALMEMPTVAALAVDLDANGRDELVALTRGDAAAQRPGELWIFRGGTSPTRQLVLPVALAPSDLLRGSASEGEQELWLVSRTPGSLLRLRFAHAPESWSSAARETFALPGAEAFVRGAGRVQVRDDRRVYALEGTPPLLVPKTEAADELGPATWLQSGDTRILLAARASAVAVLAEGRREARECALPAGKQLFDVGVAGGGSTPEQGLLLIRGEEQPPSLSLVVLPATLRDEASEIELATGALEAARNEARVPLE